MAKGEREKARGLIEQQISDIKTAVGGDVDYLKASQPGAQAQAKKSYESAAASAGGLASGTANPYATALAGGEANKYATNLAVTGGISEDEANKMETSASRGVRSVYDVLGAEAKRKQAITGGYGGGGEISQMARQVGQREAEAVTDTKARIAGLRQTGRISGAQMVGQQQLGGAELISQGQIAGSKLLTQQYGLSQDQANTLMNQIMEAQKMGMQFTAQDISMMVELSKQPGGLMAAVSGIGQLAGGVGGMLTGIGAL